MSEFCFFFDKSEIFTRSLPDAPNKRWSRLPNVLRIIIFLAEFDCFERNPSSNKFVLNSKFSQKFADPLSQNPHTPIFLQKASLGFEWESFSRIIMIIINLLPITPFLNQQIYLTMSVLIVVPTVIIIYIFLFLCVFNSCKLRID